ncbi:hypothetical protein GCM10010924_28780 [Rhizobium wenxiniae]|nr:hypothetical protein GCM10010924_28780 [Rhizobium wenxiniae]
MGLIVSDNLNESHRRPHPVLSITPPIEMATLLKAKVASGEMGFDEDEFDLDF